MVIYDADCGFCTRSAEFLGRRSACEISPWQSLDLAAVGLTERTSPPRPTGSRTVARRGAGLGAIAAALRSCRGSWATGCWGG